MASAGLETLELHAVQVCDICRLRKKRCDKSLPICGYCSQRALVCNYTASVTTTKPTESNISSKRAAIYPSPAPSSVYSVEPPISQPLDILCPSTRSILLLSDSLPKSTGLATIHDILHHQVQHIIRATCRYVDEITVRYFQGTHRWMPIISRRRFHDQLVDSRGLHTAEFSILLLAMSLITYCPMNISGTVPDQETLYLCTKMLFAQVQASVPLSTNLIQAGILIAIFEYASARPEIAFVSIETCARMAHALGSSSKRNLFSSSQDLEEGLKAAEEANVVWGIMICERLFNHETKPPIHHLAILHPEIYESLPSEVEILDGNDEPYIMPQSISALDSNNIGSFGRHAQAAYLTNKLFNATSILDRETRHAELSRIDEQLQAFLSKVMEQGCSNGSWGPYCGAISTGVRALFTLHHRILEDFSTTSSNSLATLKTATKMAIDIAHFHENTLTLQNIDILSPSYTYIARAALVYMDERLKLRGGVEMWKRDYEAVRKSQGLFERRWGIVGMKA